MLVLPMFSDPRSELVGIVSSTGGPAALHTLLAGLSSDFDVPIVIVQHLPAGFAESMAANLARRTGRDVRIARQGMTLLPGLVVVAPGERHLEVVRIGARLRCALVDGVEENGCRPAGDRMLRTAAEATNGKMVGVCLTGMGRDGAKGMQTLDRFGGHVVVQDEASSVVWGMPSAVLEAGVRASVLPLDRIPGSLGEGARRAA